MKKQISFVSFEENEKLMLQEMASRSHNERLAYLRILQRPFYKMPRKKDFDLYPVDKNQNMIVLKRKV